MSATGKVLCFLLLMAMAVGAQADSIPRTISVTGEAEVQVVPDEIVISLSLITTNPVLSTAKNDNDELVQQLMTQVNRLGVKPKDVQTGYMDIRPVYDRHEGSRRFEHYSVARTIQIVLTNPDRFETLVTAVLEAGIDRINGLQLRTSKPRPHEDMARELALTAAKEKATAMASVLDQRIGRPVSITEETANGWWGAASYSNVTMNTGGAVDENGDSLALGEITVKARVKVTFELL